MAWDIDDQLLFSQALSSLTKAVDKRGDDICNEVSLLSNDLTGIRNAIEDLNATLALLMQLLMELNKSLKSGGDDVDTD